jgi:hypothetical protein
MVRFRSSKEHEEIHLSGFLPALKLEISAEVYMTFYKTNNDEEETEIVFVYPF